MRIAKDYEEFKEIILFGVMDGIANEFEEFENLTYPAILLFKKGYLLK